MCQDFFKAPKSKLGRCNLISQECETDLGWLYECECGIVWDMSEVVRERVG